MEIIEMCFAALFNRKPEIGDINPEGEIHYAGYSRVSFLAIDGTNLTKITFPESKQEEPVFASHVVALDGRGKVVGVKEIDGAITIRKIVFKTDDQ